MGDGTQDPWDSDDPLRGSGAIIQVSMMRVASHRCSALCGTGGHAFLLHEWADPRAPEGVHPDVEGVQRGLGPAEIAGTVVGVYRVIGPLPPVNPGSVPRLQNGEPAKLTGGWVFFLLWPWEAEQHANSLLS